MSTPGKPVIGSEQIAFEANAVATASDRIQDVERAVDELEPLMPDQQPKTTRPIYWRKQLYLVALGIGAAVVLLVVGRSVAHHATPRVPVPFRGRLATGLQGAVAVEAEECSAVGVDILKQGGNAVDSAIASALCIGVIDSFATGIGGGGFLLIRSPNGTYEFIDFRETAPAASHVDMFSDDPTLAQVGGLSVGVPGEIRGFELAHQRHGTLSWAALFEPAIQIARHGFKTTQFLHEKLQIAKPWLLEKPEWAEVYAPYGTIAKVGDVIKRTKLADTLETIARKGADAFYKGAIAESLVNVTQANGGILTVEDMAAYRPLLRETISTYYHGRKVTTGSAPSSGPLLLSALNLLERFNLRVEGRTGLNVHRLVEALKHGFAIRTELGDPEFTKLHERYAEVITKDWAARVRNNISDDTTFDPLYYQPKFDHIETPGTMHLSVVDKDDGAVALTSTVNLLFGARVLDPITGVILNDEMDDFSIPGKPNTFGLYPSSYNYIAPGKRPLSTITPTIIERDGLFELSLGASGGSQIASATLNAIINTLDYGMDIYDAVSTSRIHHQLMPNIAGLEKGFDPKLRTELEKRGHETFELTREYTVSSVQAVRRLPDGTVHAASDPRKYGVAAAY